MKTMEIELIKVEAIETPEGATGTWNRFWWEVKINGLNYGLSQDIDIEFSLTNFVEFVQDSFDEKQKTLNGE